MEWQWCPDFIEPICEGENTVIWMLLTVQHFSVPTSGANANRKKALKGVQFF